MTMATLHNGTERHAAAARYLRSVDDGAPLTGRELAEEFGRSPRWGRDVIAEARVALVAAAASYSHMYNLALLAGEPVWIARAWPITVDGLVIAALRRGEEGRAWLLLGLAISVASNVLAQYPPAVVDVSPLVSAWPPLALYGTHRLLHRAT